MTTYTTARNNDLSMLLKGGTFFSEVTPAGLKPAEYGEQIPLLERYAQKFLQRYNPDLTELPPEDSTDMHFSHYLETGDSVRQKVRKGKKSVIVVQGTDSMTYANAFFSVRFPFKDFYLGVTGSMYPLSHPETDARNNLALALLAGVDKLLFSFGTYNSINEGEVLRASRSVKLRPNEIVVSKTGTHVVPTRNAFQSVNYPLLGRLSQDIDDTEQNEYLILYDRENSIAFARKQDSFGVQLGFLLNHYGRIEYFKGLKEVYGHPIFLTDYTPVYVAELHPNFDPKDIDRVADKYSVFLIKATGTGGVFNTPAQMNLIPRIRSLTRNGQFVAITSRIPQAIIETSYEVNRGSVDAGAILTADMHSEMVLVKAELAGALARTQDEFRQLMLYPFEDEINTDILPPDQRTKDSEVFEILKRNGTGKSPVPSSV